MQMYFIFIASAIAMAFVAYASTTENKVSFALVSIASTMKFHFAMEHFSED